MLQCNTPRQPNLTLLGLTGIDKITNQDTIIDEKKVAVNMFAVYMGFGLFNDLLIHLPN